MTKTIALRPPVPAAEPCLERVWVKIDGRLVCFWRAADTTALVSRAA